VKRWKRDILSGANRPRDEDMEPAATRRHRFGRFKWVIAPGLVLSLAFGVYAIRRLTHRPPLPDAQRVRLAVLPFENLTGNQEQQFFADGLHEEMIFRLARIQPRQLSVIARTSVMRYRDASKAVDAIGHELGVDFVLEGSVRRVDDRFRVTAQLIRAKDQLHLWTETYERSWNDIFAIQSDVSARVADSLAVELVPQSAAFKAQEAVSSKAHEHFLKGRFYWNQRAHDPSGQLARAIEQYKLAIAEQPDYAMAYAGLADAYNSIFFDNPGVGETAYSTARDALEHALQLDPRLAPAYSTLGWMSLHFSRDLAEAEQDFQRAAEIAPTDPLTQFRHAHLAAARGHVREAEREVEAARQSDPLSGSIAEFLGWLAYYRGDNATATLRMREAADLDGDPTRLHLFAAYSLAVGGDCINALTELQPWTNSADTLRLAEAVFARARCSDKASNDGLQQALLIRRLTYSTAMFHFARGERNEFYEWLNRSIDEHFPETLYLAIDPVFARERADPRFETAVRRAGL
jgi:TolB-like protein/Flp pilus assembly protein TadD